MLLAILLLGALLTPFAHAVGFIYPPPAAENGSENIYNDIVWLIGSTVNLTWNFAGDSSNPPAYGISIAQISANDPAVSIGVGPDIYDKNASDPEVGHFLWKVTSNGANITDSPSFLMTLQAPFDSNDTTSFETVPFNLTDSAAAAASASATPTSSAGSGTGAGSSGSGSGSGSSGTGTGSNGSSSGGDGSATVSADGIATATGTGGATGTSSGSSSSTSSGSASGSGLSGGAIAGIAIGAVAGVVLLGLGVWLLSRRFSLVRRPKAGDAGANGMGYYKEGRGGAAEAPNTGMVEAPNSQLDYEMEGSHMFRSELPAR